MSKEITENTRLPISLVIVVIGVVIWLVRVEGRVDANAKESDITAKKQEVYLSTVQKIDKRLSRIEGRLRIEPKDGP